MKRRRSVPGRASSTRRAGSRARASSSWCSVGTAEYAGDAVVAGHAPECASGLNFAGTTTVPPLESVASVEATRPWTWNSGITHMRHIVVA